jgi:hypothetical protein
MPSQSKQKLRRRRLLLLALLTSSTRMIETKSQFCIFFAPQLKGVSSRRILLEVDDNWDVVVLIVKRYR